MTQNGVPCVCAAAAAVSSEWPVPSCVAQFVVCYKIEQTKKETFYFPFAKSSGSAEISVVATGGNQDVTGLRDDSNGFSGVGSSWEEKKKMTLFLFEKENTMATSKLRCCW